MQTDLFSPTQITAEAIERSVSHADAVIPSWSEKAYNLLREYISTYRVFQCEDFRKWCIGSLKEPPSKRAFGSVILKAAKENLITRIGYEKVKNIKAHQTPASVWQSNIHS